MNLRRLWLLFAQATTVGLALLFVIGVFAPGWLPWRASVVTVTEEQAPEAAAETPVTLSFQAAARRATPSVVNIYTAKLVRSPLLGDPFLRRIFRRRPRAGYEPRLGRGGERAGLYPHQQPRHRGGR